MKFSEKWGNSIDSAVELALQDLKLTRDQVKVTVIEEPSRGFLGLIGNKLAKVRVEEIVPETKAEPVVPKEEPKAAEPVKPAPRAAKESRTENKVSYQSRGEVCIEVCGQDSEEDAEQKLPAAKPARSRRSRSKKQGKAKTERRVSQEALKAEAEYEDAGILSEKP